MFNLESCMPDVKIPDLGLWQILYLIKVEEDNSYLTREQEAPTIIRSSLTPERKRRHAQI